MMNKKQNSLMRFSRTERLAQLSEQEIVIEKKKKEIQAKLEAQKKKETEEAFKKFEFSKETKSSKSGFSKKSWSENEVIKNANQEKPDENPRKSLTNAFSNDGSFLDQFKKLSQSKLSNYEMPTLATPKKRESDFKNSKNSSEKNFSKGENQKIKNVINRDDKKDEKSQRNNSLSSFVGNSSDSEVNLPTSTHRIFQFSQHQNVSTLSSIDHVKSSVLLHPVQRDPIQNITQQPDSKLLNSNLLNHCDVEKPIPSSQVPELHESLNFREFPINVLSGNLCTSTSAHHSQNTPELLPVPTLPKLTKELPKVRAESISLTLKVNTVKKLEAIPNPLEANQELSPTLKKDFNFSENENLKNTFLNASQSSNSKPIVHRVSSYDKDSSRISSALCNEDGDDDDGSKDKDKDNGSKHGGGQLNDNLQHWAGLVARCGDEFEELLRSRNDNPNLRFLSNKTSNEYLTYRKLVVKYRMRQKSEEEPLEKSRKLNYLNVYCKRSTETIFPSNKELPKTETSIEDSYEVNSNFSSEKMTLDDQERTKGILIQENRTKNEHNNVSESTQKEYCFSDSEKQTLSKETPSKNLKEENNVDECEQSKIEERRKRKRKSRWGDVMPTTSTLGIETNLELQPSGKLTVTKSTLLSQLTRSDPGLIQYARQTFGSINLSEEDWKKAEDHYKINLLYQDMIKKRAEVEKLERQGKFKYEYDSDEDTEGGTWEHKLRQQEMQATQLWAEELTRQAAGKHHIGDFLPPEELERFMEKYNAVKEGREPDLSDYKEYKLKEDNVGYRLLQKMGWNEGQGLGQDGSGITNPVNKATTRHENQGLGIDRPDGLEPGDDEYDAYRKRMMLAYRFRPNPLNNPRRPYY